ncbi:NAD-dependent epimerase/dehydratase family protein [Streptomyces sp. enrichment culture]|uniref:NAD-dependent epimerase/dehydratase family protein n=1 Tax=Streptomyces sp. enrichment culture TaxID=1795815 RepID=UPI003F545B3D
MRVIVFGASGMIGYGALHASLRDDAVTEVVAVVRTPLDVAHPRLRQIVHADFTDFTAIQDELTGLDACFYCLGVSAVGRSEAEYTRVTYDYALAAARALITASPGLTFVYVSGEGTDPTGQSRQMWARVKGRTENDLQALPMTSYMFRLGFVQPVDGAVSRTPLYRRIYRATAALHPLLDACSPGTSPPRTLSAGPCSPLPGRAAALAPSCTTPTSTVWPPRGGEGDDGVTRPASR